MVSGYYKYIVFEELERSTGKVYDEPCHRLMGHAVDLPNTDWVAENHWCAPLYYRPADVAPSSRPSPGSWEMKALVTGGAGFIGSHVVDKLAAAGHEPRILDLIPSPYHDPAEVETVIGDLTDASDRARGARRLRRDLPPRRDGRRQPGGRRPGPHRRASTRAAPSRCSRQRARSSSSRFLYASTVWVYGNAPGPEPHDEDTPLVLPPHLYTATKLAGEMYCRAYESMYGVSTTILRFGIPYGPRARPAAVVPAFIDKAAAGEPLTIAGDGSQTRQFVYVEDLAEGMVAALAPAGAGRIYNLVGDELVSVKQIADTVRELVADVPVEQVPDRPVDLKFGQASSARAGDELGWRGRDELRRGCPPLRRLARRDERLAGRERGVEHRRQRSHRLTPRARRRCRRRCRAAARPRPGRDRASRARRSTGRSPSPPSRDPSATRGAAPSARGRAGARRG